MRNGLALYAAARQLEETARHLNWIDNAVRRIRQTAAGRKFASRSGKNTSSTLLDSPCRPKRCGNFSTPLRRWSLWSMAFPFCVLLYFLYSFFSFHIMLYGGYT